MSCMTQAHLAALALVFPCFHSLSISSVFLSFLLASCNEAATMWLLNTTTRKLEQFPDEEAKYGRYAILSHVWQLEEVTFQDMQLGIAEQKAGYAKIEETCRKALEDKLDYCWIDTCCIDKTSSAELSEAINSMYRWYYHSKVCYAFLFDVPTVDFKDSKWFTRGWTLQELIAPGYVEFYDECWNPIGSKISRVKELAEITRIDIKVLRDRTTVDTFSVASRMAWAADRYTSRTEDRAYSLMGIFDVYMPMLYGEGKKAFSRLQEEIIRNSTDHSILAWTGWENCHSNMLFSPDPYGFRFGHKILSWSNPGLDESFQLSNKGLRISLPTVETDEHPSHATAILNCRYSGDVTTQIAMLLKKQPHGMIVPKKELKSTVCEVATYRKKDGSLSSMRNLDRRYLPSAKWFNLMILREPARFDTDAPGAPWTQKIAVKNAVSHLELIKVHPLDSWDPIQGLLTFTMTGSSQHDRGYMVFSERDGKKKFTVAFGYETTAAGVEPKLNLSRDSTIPESSAIYRSLEAAKMKQQAKVEFKKGLSELKADMERHLSAIGDVEWTISLRLEHYASLFSTSLSMRQLRIP